ncbi:hypothetical protein [Paenibacillus sp. Z6-24]
MKKVMLRLLIILSLALLMGIIACFYFGYFMYAYGMIFLIVAVLFGMGQVASINNNVWLHQNSYDRHIREQTDRYRSDRED